MSEVPIFPRYGEPWFDCYICGMSHPMSHGMRHYKTRMLVGPECADKPGFSDNLECFEPCPEQRHCAEGEQPVADQGQVVTTEEGGGGTPPEGGGGGPGVPCDDQWTYNGQGVFFGSPIDATSLGNLNNNGCFFSGMMRDGYAVTIGGGGGVTDVRDGSIPLRIPITVSRFQIRVNNSPLGSDGSVVKITVELLKNGASTGMVSNFLQDLGDVVTTTGSVSFAAGDFMSWEVLFYDTDGNAYGSASVQASKRICACVEYQSGNAFFLDGERLDNSSSLSSPEQFVHPLFTGNAVAPGDTLARVNTLRFGADLEIDSYVIQMTYVWNDLDPTYQIVDGTSVWGEITSFTGAGGFPGPGNSTLQGPFVKDVNRVFPSSTAVNLDDTGSAAFMYGGTRDTLGYGQEWRTQAGRAYRFPSHPKAQYIFASAHGSGSPLRTGLCHYRSSGGLSSNAASRMYTPLMIKGQFHHFAFWHYSTVSASNATVVLMVDGSPLWTATIPAGDRITLDGTSFICVDGSNAWWEFTMVNADVGVSCLYGPVGT